MDDKLPDIPQEERTPLVLALMEIIRQLQERVRLLEDEIARLKGNKPRPQILKSTLEKEPVAEKPAGDGGKRAGSEKRPKTSQLIIHNTYVLSPENIPDESVFKGYQDYTVQGLVIRPNNTLYRLEVWQMPSGEIIRGELPPGVRELGHYDADLIAYVLYQHHHQQVTQPRLLEHLRDLDVDISSGQLNRLLTERKDPFHEEKDAILPAGLSVSKYVNVDDTGARHDGKNGYATHIGNEFFASFTSTDSKSRVNFLAILRGGHTDYVLGEMAFDYARDQGLSAAVIDLLQNHAERTFPTKAAWEKHLDDLGVKGEGHRRTATEAALLGSALEHGVPTDLVIVSDDAGQFNVLIHALCWIHAERNINKLTPFSDAQRADWEKVRSDIWQLYRDLKAYKSAPSEEQKPAFEARFDEICARRTCFATLNQSLKRMGQNKAELLRVLERPEIPLHNNTSERDIRDYATKRKVSGGTRSGLGRRCRDTFMSLKKTCKKLGISFWHFLRDRLHKTNAIPPLPEAIRQKAAAFVSS